MAFRPTIGLEIHAELKTQTKMFCSSKNNPDEEHPNTNVCPICLAHPGTLPVINREAVRHVLRVGTALGSKIADYTEFDRKSYFYPDIPKGYQISQYQHPLVSGGSLAGVDITRVHLEEDTARSIHGGDKSLVDFNRAGIPLMELVTEPVIPDAATAGKFARELQLLLRTLGAGDANLEKGEMRIEANVSVSREGEPMAKNYVEVKNINSFRSVERAIEFEIKRQIALIEEGGEVVKATRGWDESRQQTFPQRLKEGAADYRYFPEPDLPKLLLSEIPEFSSEALQASLPELPDARRSRYTELGLKSDDAEFITASIGRSAFFDAVVNELASDVGLVKLAANYLVSDLAGLQAKVGTESFETIIPAQYAGLMRALADGTLSSRGGKDVLAVMYEKGGDYQSIAKELGVLQVSDPEALGAVAREVIGAHAGVVAEYKAGKEEALHFLVGQAMKASRGAGNPNTLRKLIKDLLA